MKNDVVYKRGLNALLDVLQAEPLGSFLPSENSLAARLSLSRTTVRKILRELSSRKKLSCRDGLYTIVEAAQASDYFSRLEITPTLDRVERMFMEWMLRGDRRSGDLINGLELARQFKVPPSAIREYLNRFSRFGLLEKRRNSSWAFRGFTTDFALELCKVRELFETSSACAFAGLPPEAPEWCTLGAIAREHQILLENIDDRFHDFSELDDRLHRLVNSASRNRFFLDFHDLISLIFHYHYQWNKVDEKERNRTAIVEHLSYIDAFFSRDLDRIETSCRAHLASARKTLLLSIAC